MKRLKFIKTPLDGLLLLERALSHDNRGIFSRIYCEDELHEAHISLKISQINHSFSKLKGTIRGMHFQITPYSDAKLITCTQGSIFDVAIDIRKNSPTYLQWFGAYLNGDDNKSIFIPKGFAHGFQTLSDNVHLIYLHSDPYHESAQGGISPFDPLINISWPLSTNNISNRDKNFPFIKNIKGLNYEL